MRCCDCAQHDDYAPPVILRERSESQDPPPERNQPMTDNTEPAFRPYRVVVARKQRLSPHFMRITFTGESLNTFGTDGYDQRIKILLPLADGSWPDPLLFADEPQHGSQTTSHTEPQHGSHIDTESETQSDSTSQPPSPFAWYERWRAMPPERRYTIRTYTIRAVDQEQREVTVDFVLHEGAGPAGAFAADCQLGDEIGIIGPNARSKDSAIGIDFHPGSSQDLLLVGDETAVPAIGSILTSLARDAWHGRTTVLVEVPEPADQIMLPTLPGVTVDWQARQANGQAPAAQGSTLVERTRSYARRFTEASSGTALEDVDVDKDLLWEVPESPVHPNSDSVYAWIAGEAAAVRDIRRILVGEHHIDRHQVAFMGYWRLGKAEAD